MDLLTAGPAPVPADNVLLYVGFGWLDILNESFMNLDNFAKFVVAVRATAYLEVDGFINLCWFGSVMGFVSFGRTKPGRLGFLVRFEHY